MNPPCTRAVRFGRVQVPLYIALMHGQAAAMPLPTIPEHPSSHVLIEVELDPTIPDAEALADWIHETSTTAVLPPASAPRRHGTLRVSVSGALYDYQVAITTIRDGTNDEDTTGFSCECTNDELLERISDDIDAAASRLEEPPPVSDPPPTPVTSPAPARGTRRVELGHKGKVGQGLVVAGAAGALAGTVLVGIGRSKHVTPYLDDPSHGSQKNYGVPGVPTLVVGAGLFAAGSVLLVLDRRDSQGRRPFARLVPTPRVTPDGMSLGWTRRF